MDGWYSAPVTGTGDARAVRDVMGGAWVCSFLDGRLDEDGEAVFELSLA